MKKDTKTLTTSDRPGTSRSFRLMSWVSAGILLLLPFHAFLTVWGSSIFGHYTLLRLWKEILLVALVMAGLTMWPRKQEWSSAIGAGWGRLIRRHWVVPAIMVYLALLVVCGGVAWLGGDVAPKALAYGLLLDARFLLFFVVCWLVSLHSDRLTKHWHHILLIPAAVTVVFGLLQFTVLPDNFLTHFGYGPDTIPAIQTVDQKDAYQRIQSTLRGANPFGAYLIVIIAATGVFVLRRLRFHRWRAVSLLAGACLALLLTFSRSAWLGAMAALGWLLYQAIGPGRPRRLLLTAGCVGLLVFAAVGYSLRQNDVFQNTILHTDEHSLSAASSNQGHLGATSQGLHEIVQEPLGRGTGTAGPASVYNDRGSRPGPRIAENYYLQIGQEAGVFGMLLFIAINLLVGAELWRRRTHLLPAMLLASLIGISIVNLLSHAWTDDTLSYIWWGLAGAALALPALPAMKSQYAPKPQKNGKYDASAEA
jgi:hypothetical protein